MKNKYCNVRLSEDEYILMQKLTTEYGITRAEAVRLGLQLYFDHYANCDVKKSGQKVWKE